MGFQFNQVGGGTKTRRPIALRMQYKTRTATSRGATCPWRIAIRSRVLCKKYRRTSNRRTGGWKRTTYAISTLDRSISAWSTSSAPT
ncbi:unnamed protein product [Scytosiphon promiscuus]